MNTKVLILACVCALVVVQANAWETPDWDEWVKEIKEKWSPKSVTVEEQAPLAADPDAKCKFEDTKVAADGCNTCWCDDEGNWDCTRNICG